MKESETDAEFIIVGRRLLSVREPTKLNQTDFALRNGFNTTQYNNWETGKRRIPIDKALVLCDRYGITLDFIYRGREDGLSESARKVISSQ